MNKNDPVIVSAVRTPFDKFGGSMREIPGIDLGAMVIREALDRVDIDYGLVEDVFYGTCVPAETALETNIPARQAILKAGFPPQTRSLTIDRACCSSLTAVGMGCDAIKSGRTEVCLAVGVENMSRAALLIPPKVRWGTKIGSIDAFDALSAIGYADFNPVSVDAGEIAVEMGVTREDQDQWALGSQQRYSTALAEEKFKVGEELMRVTLPSRKGDITIETDQQPRPGTTLEKLAALKPVYGSSTVTPGNAPGLNAGASAILLMSRARANSLNLEILAMVRAAAGVAGPVREIAKIPAPAIQNVLKQADLTLEDMDLIEINEAFAAMPLVSAKILADGDTEKFEQLKKKINVNGGAIAIGHPVGASGARILMTLMYELKRRGGGFGAAAICGGLAQGEAAVIEV